MVKTYGGKYGRKPHPPVPCRRGFSAIFVSMFHLHIFLPIFSPHLHPLLQLVLRRHRESRERLSSFLLLLLRILILCLQPAACPGREEKRTSTSYPLVLWTASSLSITMALDNNNTRPHLVMLNKWQLQRSTTTMLNVDNTWWQRRHSSTMNAWWHIEWWHLEISWCWQMERGDDMDNIKKDTSSQKMKKIWSWAFLCTAKNPGGTPGEVGQKIWHATTNTTSQEAGYGTIFGETERNMEKYGGKYGGLALEIMGLIKSHDAVPWRHFFLAGRDSWEVKKFSILATPKKSHVFAFAFSLQTPSIFMGVPSVEKNVDALAHAPSRSFIQSGVFTPENLGFYAFASCSHFWCQVPKKVLAKKHNQQDQKMEQTRRVTFLSILYLNLRRTFIADRKAAFATNNAAATSPPKS